MRIAFSAAIVPQLLPLLPRQRRIQKQLLPDIFLSLRIPASEAHSQHLASMYHWQSDTYRCICHKCGMELTVAPAGSAPSSVLETRRTETSLPTGRRSGPTTPDRDSLGAALIVPHSLSKLQSNAALQQRWTTGQDSSGRLWFGMNAFHEKEMRRPDCSNNDRQAAINPASALTGRCSSDHTGATHAAYPTLHCEPPARFLTRLLCVVEPFPLVASKRLFNVQSDALWPEAFALLALCICLLQPHE